ncbi:MULTISPECIES: type II toxin-antitoxin system RelE/ParE family toxin [Hyphomicrobiales]|nr:MULTISPECIES: type II toxin-antitoxin system RelE/ParE family toxin [Hyphomicrobiales]MDH0699708.1 type II toxin-antitoxin system RelE/ParE family toxin [Agrobacterium sp. GD03871]MDH1062581.1 type II toxin-antitoxin system RelE/ParE family toxin [Agrobacterium sp. GD03992]MDH2228072.1 type II toxin-antitoxin system RelE/ParE family toxin [Agrobacterium sp. GD03642]
MRIFKTKWMVRFVRRERINDASLEEAIERAERGIIDADLGGGLIKQRVARPGQGRSGGFRMIVAYRTEDRAFFLYGFAKNERENIDDDELQTLRDIAADLLTQADSALDDAVNAGKLQEIENGKEA